MQRKPAAWEELLSGGKVLKLWETDLNPDWPRVVVLTLTAELFSEFDRNPLAFAEKHKLYGEQPVLWTSHCAKPPRGKGIPEATESSSWTVVINHTKDSLATFAACPQTTTG
ncbi:MAG: hypothetical protein ABSH01_13550 [Terriglobia bacterium]|jgi:hypothetical protein